MVYQSGTTVQSVTTTYCGNVLSQPATFTSHKQLTFGPTFTGVTRGSPGVTQTVTQTANSAIVTTSNTVNVQSWTICSWTGIPADTFVSSVSSQYKSITLTEAATSSATQAMIFGTMGTGGCTIVHLQCNCSCCC
jgi:hypothetical protein